MSMSQEYQQMYNAVHDLEFKIKDALDKPADPAAQELRKELYELHEQLEMNKHPRDIEDRIKSIQKLLMEARSHPDSYMDIQEADHFYDIFEDMRRDVRGLPGY